jgi:H+/Cl- antiporter ClcA
MEGGGETAALNATAD